jgi:hypothetical protein
MRLIGCAIAITSSCSAPPAHADLVIDLPDSFVILGSNPISAQLPVVLRLTGEDLTNPPMVSSFNVAFDLSGVGLSFSAAQAATTNALFTGGDFNDFGSSTMVRAAHDIFPDSTSAFHGAVLTVIPFTIETSVPPGTVFEFTWDEDLTQLTNAAAMPLELTLLPGSIRVEAIPEARAWLMLTLAGLVMAMFAMLRRRRPASLGR